ncbi:hypothetical protein Nepgr_024380 [Nepenthes gracilis]|uniref:Uncharacterized protein n=1 Tax=Nepenthes gracilis TaxID=150966 RepID=A0AAD3T4H8_NEPGR|nr:hypothetical protein Nepgr_024380 [Nepenthes gracilis]
MGRAPCCSKVGLHRGPWTPREDNLLVKYIQAHGEGQWRSLPKKAGLLRCGKSCRLRWMNYLRPDIKRGNITPDEDDLIIRLHALLGNRWSLIAGRLSGRTDNEIKNYWNTHLSKKLRSQGVDPNTHKKLSELNPPVQKLAAPKKRIKNTACSNHTKNKGKKQPKRESGLEREKTKIHLPKAVRVTSLSPSRNNSNTSFESCMTTASISPSNGSAGYRPSDRDKPRPDSDPDDRVGFFIGCDAVDLVNGSFPKDQSNVAASDEQLEDLYEEYLQLIEADNHDRHDDHAQLELLAESLLS